MCPYPMTASSIWDAHREDLLVAAAATRRAGECHKPLGRGWLIAAGMRRLGAALVALGTRLQRASAAGSVVPASPGAAPGAAR